MRQFEVARRIDDAGPLIRQLRCHLLPSGRREVFITY